MKNNCFVTKDDVFKIIVYDKEQTIDFFGAEYLDEFGMRLPPELLKKYKTLKKELDKIEKEIQQVLDGA